MLVFSMTSLASSHEFMPWKIGANSTILIFLMYLLLAISTLSTYHGGGECWYAPYSVNRVMDTEWGLSMVNGSRDEPLEHKARDSKFPIRTIYRQKRMSRVDFPGVRME
jgi:hypothetical protein